MLVNDRALLPRHTAAVNSLINALTEENGQVLVRPPGFGKTRTAVAAIIRLARKSHTTIRCLILAPTMLQDVWRREIQAVSDARFAVVGRGKGAKTRKTLDDAHFVFVSHRMLVSGCEYALSPVMHWPFIICTFFLSAECMSDTQTVDEAHQIRQPTTCINARIQDLRNLQPHARMLLLTATPYINCAVDVVSLLAAAAADWSLLNYMGLPTQQHYARLLINSDEDRSWLQGIKCTEHLETLNMRPCEIEQYNDLISDFINTYDHCTAHVKGSCSVRGSLMRLRRQLEAPCNLSAAESAKLGRMVDIIRGVPVTQRTIVFCVYRNSFAEIERVVRTELGRPVFCLHGGVPKSQRAKLIDDWEGTRGAVLVAQLFVAGVGLNLQTVCSTAIFLLRWYNKPMEMQAVGRICRFGQKRDTNVYFLRYNCYIEIDWIGACPLLSALTARH